MFRPFIGNERLLNCIGYSADRKLLTLSEPKSEYTCLFSSYRMVLWYLQLYYLCLVSLPILLREYSFQFSSVSWDTRDPVKVDTRLFIHLSISIISLFYTATRCLHNWVYYAQTRYIHTFFKKNKTEESFSALLCYFLCNTNAHFLAHHHQISLLLTCNLVSCSAIIHVLMSDFTFISESQERGRRKTRIIQILKMFRFKEHKRKLCI